MVAPRDSSTTLDHEPRSRYDGVPMSWEEFLALPEEKPYLEYIDGRVVQKMAPRPVHWLAVAQIVAAFVAYEHEHGGMSGPEPRVRFELPGEMQSRLPDIGYWAPGKPLDDGLGGSLSPTLAVEVLSPGDKLDRQREKCRFYRLNGVDVCRLIDP